MLLIVLLYLNNFMQDSITIYNGNNVLILLHANAEVPALEGLLFFTDKKDDAQVVETFLSGKERNICFMGDQPIKLLERIKKHFTFIEAAGGVVKNNDEKYLLIYRLQKWDLPKGKAETGETPEETAVREVQEETALDHVNVVCPLRDTYHIYPLKKKIVLKCTHWFEMKHEGAGVVTPQTSENIEKVEWLDKSDFPTILKNTYPSISDVLSSL